ncbi:hypothetical protein PWT90_07866 [Aphanocladium album]|nr:hypothetical protein PWT90_07866 [Aphanocladium album]
MKLSTATTALLAQMALCDMAAREAKVTPAAALLGRRAAQNDQCDTGKTACGDGNGCCPRGSKCTSSKGVGVCADACYSATLFCSFGSGIELCCQPGAGCDYSRSVCTQHSTDKGGVWTSPSTSSATDGTPLPTGPVFTSTSGQDETTTTESSSAEETQTSQSSTETDSSSGGSAPATDSSSGAGATTTKNPKDSGSAIVASWSAGVLAVVFGIMVAL